MCVVAGIINVLIVGAGGLGLWTLKVAEYEVGEANMSRVRLTVADSSVSCISPHYPLTSPSGGVRSIVMSVSVCLPVCPLAFL